MEKPLNCCEIARVLKSDTITSESLASEMAAASTTKKKSQSGVSGRKRPPHLKIAIIGAGRLGTTLARALKQTGHQIGLVITNHTRSAKRAAADIGVSMAFGRRQFEHSAAAAQRLQRSDLLIISTPDDVIESVATQLAKTFRGVPRRNHGRPKIALHTSGALSSEILAPLRDAGFAVGSIHPLVSIADSTTAANIFRGSFFCIEGDRRASRAARAIVKQLGGRGFSIGPESKPLYHAAAAISSGHVVALFDLATETLERSGLSRRRAEQILLPLVESTIKNLTAKGPVQALTGPLARGDLATAQKHLASMEAHGLSEAAKIYAMLGRRALKLAKDLGTNPRQLDRIAQLLASRDPDV